MRLRTALLTIASILILTIAGCGQTDTSPSNEEASIPAFIITVEVVGEDTFEFTEEDAKEIGPVEMIAAQKDGDDLLEADTWTGIRLYDYLDYIGVQEFSVITVEAADGFSQELDPSRIDEQGTGFGWAVNGEMLDAESGPIKLVNHGRGSKWWVKQLSKVTIIK